MAYLVSITRRAERDLTALYEEINAQHAGEGLEWCQGRKRAILSLESHPKRCPAVIRKSDKLRHLLYSHKPHVYRVIYGVMKKQKRVEVLHIRHGARGKLKRTDLS
jgi:toxin ParE1/3/4